MKYWKQATKNQRIFYGCAAGFLAIVLPLLYFKNPAESELFPPCPTEHFFGFYCPGCGSLRAMHLLLHGAFAEAVSQNILVVCFLVILPLMLFFPKPFRHPAFSIGVLLLVIVFAVLRNLEWFHRLAPH